MKRAGRADLRLAVLGCCGAKAAPGRFCSGYLLEHGPARLWLDCGGGTLSQLLLWSTLADLDLVALSHLHGDHWTDLPLAVHTLKQEDPDRRLRVLGPPGFRERVGEPVRAQEGGAVDAEELRDGLRVEAGGARLLFRAVEHGDLDCFGVRVEGDAGVFAYSADTGPCAALAELADGVDLFLCEAGAASAPSDTHLTPEQAGDVAEAAGVGTLVLTHLREGDDPDDAAARARSRFRGELVVARDGLDVRPRATARAR